MSLTRPCPVRASRMRDAFLWGMQGIRIRVLQKRNYAICLKKSVNSNNLKKIDKFIDNSAQNDIILSLTVQKRKTSRISSVYAGFETFFIVNRYAYVAPSFWKNRMKGARARLSLIPGAEFSTRAYLSYMRLSYFFVCLHMFLIFAIGINSFEVSNPKAWCRESVSSLRL